MKKFAVGLIVGAALMVAGQVFAESSSKIGKMVQGEITVIFDGTELQTTGIVIDGVSYLPLRAIGTVMGLGVDYVDGKVILISPTKEAETSVEDIQEAVEKEIERREKEKQKQDLQTRITNLENQLSILNEQLTKEEVETVRQSIQTTINTVEAKLAELRAELAELEAE